MNVEAEKLAAKIQCAMRASLMTTKVEEKAMTHVTRLVELASARNTTIPELPPVEGDVLPAIGSTVSIHLARQDEWVNHTVVGYYVWPELDGKKGWRVNVRVQDSEGYNNARSLEDIRPAVPEGQTRSKGT